MVKNGTSIYLLFIFIGIINMVSYNVIPFLIYHQIFYFDKSKKNKILLNNIMIFVSLFFIFSSLMNLIYIHLIDN